MVKSKKGLKIALQARALFVDIFEMIKTHDLSKVIFLYLFPDLVYDLIIGFNDLFIIDSLFFYHPVRSPFNRTE